jgi:hypothetical protein
VIEDMKATSEVAIGRFGDSHQLWSMSITGLFSSCSKGSHHSAIFLAFFVAKSDQVCYSDQGRLERYMRRKSGVAMATGRVS